MQWQKSTLKIYLLEQKGTIYAFYFILKEPKHCETPKTFWIHDFQMPLNASSVKHGL